MRLWDSPETIKTQKKKRQTDSVIDQGERFLLSPISPIYDHKPA